MTFDLEKMQEEVSKQKPIEELIDINDVKINLDLPIEQRLENFIKQIHNPYYYKCKNRVVKITFSQNEKTLSEKLTQHFIRKKSR